MRINWKEEEVTKMVESGEINDDIFWQIIAVINEILDKIKVSL